MFVIIVIQIVDFVKEIKEIAQHADLDITYKKMGIFQVKVVIEIILNCAQMANIMMKEIEHAKYVIVIVPPVITDLIIV